MESATFGGKVHPCAGSGNQQPCSSALRPDRRGSDCSIRYHNIRRIRAANVEAVRILGFAEKLPVSLNLGEPGFPTTVTITSASELTLRKY